MSDRMLLNPAANILSMDLDPLIITSPTPRSGTTLLQRLLSSSQHGLIYGEKCSQDLEIFLNIFLVKMHEYSFRREMNKQELQNVLQGDANDWLFALMPDLDGYLAVLHRSAFAGISYCRDYAIQSGRPVWGFKYPGWSSSSMIDLLHTSMPKSRFIFILRDLSSCLKSAKAQQWVSTEQSVREFCQKWMDGFTFAQRMKNDDAFLVLDYQGLVDRQEDILAKITSFSGLQDINWSVLDHKINDWTSQQGGNLKAGYVSPIELVEREWAIVDETMSLYQQTVTNE